MNNDQVDAFGREISLMTKLKHPRILQFCGACIFNNTELAIVMDYLEGGSLYRLLISNNSLSDLEIYHIALDITSGIAYLHEQKVIHRDLKTRNVLLDNQRRAKVAYFGVSKIISSSPGTPEVGTYSYMAPEVFKVKIL